VTQITTFSGSSHASLLQKSHLGLGINHQVVQVNAGYYLHQPLLPGCPLMKTPSCSQPNNLQASTLSNTNSNTKFNRLLEKFLTGALLTLAIGVTAASLPAQSVEVPAIAQPTPTSDFVEMASTNASQPLADGVYLYGQSDKANEIGSTYLVFEIRNRQVMGAFYMPSSSFDCFQGEVQGDRLALMVRNSYEQISYPYSVAMAPDATVASSDNLSVESIQLAGFQPIETIDDNNYRLLETCQASY
jgi:hypothetical protein